MNGDEFGSEYYPLIWIEIPLGFGCSVDETARCDLGGLLKPPNLWEGIGPPLVDDCVSPPL